MFQCYFIYRTFFIHTNVQLPPSPPSFVEETVVALYAQKSQNVNNFAAILNGQSAQLVTYLLTRFCYHAWNAAALVNI
jgi:hypothetical protein